MKSLFLFGIFSFLLFFPPSIFSFEPLGVPDRDTIEYPDDDPPSEALAHLGKVLFFDTRLSINDSQSCATCHNPDLGFGEGMASGIGAMGERLGRNTPQIYNLAWNAVFFWDGRAKSLEEQALGPIEAAGEMNMPLGKLIPKLKAVNYYNQTFNALFEDGLTAENIGKAIAAYERTVIVDNTPFDRYMKGDFAAMSPAAIRGMELFQGKAKCAQCHGGVNFTDNGFHNIGLGDNDPGRAKIEPGSLNEGRFKTPGLRNIIYSAPYMHDGSLASLEAVVEHYNNGGNPVKNLDPLMTPLNLTDDEIFDIIAFMGAISSPYIVERPQIP